MGRRSTSDRHQALHDEAMRQFDRIQSALRDEREQCLSDRRFYSIAGAQWEGNLGEQFANKPRLEVNKIHLAILRIINEYRNNRITVDFIPRDGTDEKTADICDGLYRSTEQDSVAEEAYDNAFEEAVGGGVGAWRLRVIANDEDDPDSGLDIRIEPIFDADASVFFDLDAKRQDKSDARHCFVLSALTRDRYIEEYGEDDATSIGSTIERSRYDWSTPDVIRIAEYYVVERKPETAHVYRLLDGTEVSHTDAELEDNPDLPVFLAATGCVEVRQETLSRRQIHKYLLSGNRVLEDYGVIPGVNIPIVPVYGKRWVVDGVERCMGHVRLARDAQRLKNMQLSKLAEISSLSAVEKPIFHPEQIDQFSREWETDAVVNHAYLRVHPLTDLSGAPIPGGPVAYTKPPQVPPALAALMQMSDIDMADLLGRQESGELLQPNQSGKAVELIQQRLDMQVAIYASNMAKAMRRSGQIWLSMAREVLYEPGRRARTVALDGAVSYVELGRKTLDDAGRLVTEGDLSNADFDVVVDVGPSSSSKRAATVRALTGMLQMTQDQMTQQVLTSLVLTNLEGEGLSDVADFYRKQLVRAGVIQPTEKEAAQLQAEQAQAGQQPDPQSLYLQSAAEQAQAEAAKARADTVLTVARADESRAKSDQIRIDTQIAALNAGIEAVLTKLNALAGASPATVATDRDGEIAGSPE